MPTPSTLVAGETLVDFVPDTEGPLNDVESFSPRPGGAPANVAVAMQRLDSTPYFVTRLATDAFGDLLADRLAEAGIDDRFVQRDPDHPTALAFVTHDPEGDRSFTFYRNDAADTHLATTTVTDGLLAAIDRVVVGGVSLTVEPARTAILDLVGRAREHGCTVVFDPNVRPELWPDDTEMRSVLETALTAADVVKTATDDLAGVGYPTEPGALADQILDHGPHSVLVTRGRSGAELHATTDAPWDAGTWEHGGYDVDAVDTTGAGDAFLAGLLASLDQSDTGMAADPGERLGFANAVAALTTTGRGAWTALPGRAAVETLREESSLGS